MAGGSILYVGDPETAERVASRLERTEDAFEVVAVETASEGRDRLEEADCVVSAYRLPDGDGVDLLESVREEYPGVPFVLFPEEGSGEVASGAISAGVTEYVPRDGIEDPFEVLIDRVRDALTGDTRDVEALEEELEWYRTLVDTIPDAIYALDDEMRYLFVNEGMAELTGYPREELIGAHKSKINTDESVESGRLKRQDLYENDREGMKVALHPHVTADGEQIPTEVRFSALPTGEDDEFRGTAGVVRDISDRLERERELERQNRRLDEFASVVSHDLRSPLNVVEGRLEMARGACDCGGADEHLEEAQLELDRMDDLIEDVLTYARQGEEVTEYDEVDLEAVIDAAWAAVDSGEGRLEVNADYAVAANRLRLQRLFENLFRNAIEHVGPDVTVRVGELPDGFFVEDDGPGIPEEERENVFEPGVTTATDGTGFGLAIVKTIVESHGWSIGLADGSDGGARFEIREVEIVEGSDPEVEATEAVESGDTA